MSARITPTADAAAAEGADLVIEAVFEDPAVKAQVFAEIEPHLLPDALLGSNTSTLPITELAEGVAAAGEASGGQIGPGPGKGPVELGQDAAHAGVCLQDGGGEPAVPAADIDHGAQLGEVDRLRQRAGGRGVIAFTLTGDNDYPSAAFAGLDAKIGMGDVQIAAAGVGAWDGFTNYQI